MRKIIRDVQNKTNRYQLRINCLGNQLFLQCQSVCVPSYENDSSAWICQAQTQLRLAGFQVLSCPARDSPGVRGQKADA